MKRRRLPALIIPLAVMTIVGGYFFGRLTFRALPDLEGVLTIGGLTERVDVYRDDAGFPHILANNEHDAWIAAGYVHAQDRLWQMDVQRRYGMGRLSEIFGAEALPIDRMMRSIGIHRIADSLLQTVSQQTRDMLDAYARGVNAAIAERSSSLPIEFDLLQYEAEPWLPVHSLVIARLSGWELALSWWTDLMLQELIERFGEERAAELFPGEEQNGPVIHSTQAVLQRRPAAALLSTERPGAAHCESPAPLDRRTAGKCLHFLQLQPELQVHPRSIRYLVQIAVDSSGQRPLAIGITRKHYGKPASGSPLARH